MFVKIIPIFDTMSFLSILVEYYIIRRHLYIEIIIYILYLTINKLLFIFDNNYLNFVLIFKIHVFLNYLNLY